MAALQLIIFFILLAGFICGSRRIRLYLFTPRILAWFQKTLPPLHATELAALEAGGVYWEKELFCGRPDWNKLAAIPHSVVTLEEQAFLDTQVEQLCAMLDDWRAIETNADLPQPVWDFLKRQGFFGLQIAKQYGGHGFSVWAHSHIITKIASRSISAGITVMVPNALGPGEFLQHFGTPEQKNYYLPRLARGEEIPAFALTSLEAGSDASAITDTGIVCRGVFAGKEIIGMRLNWDKRYITLAPIATLLGLAFKLYDPEHLLGEQADIGITLCLLPTDLPGMQIGSRHCAAGLAFLNGPTRGDEVFVPLDFIIGGLPMRGKGWEIMMTGLAEGRGVSLPALSTAGSKLCYRMTGAYARLREQFHQPIGYFEGVAQALGRIGGLTYLSEATRHFTLGAIAQGVKPSLGAAITKYHLTEMGRTAVNDAMDIHAGYAIQLGPSNYLGLLYQSLPIAITVEGANILTRNLIIFGQGVLRCHPYVRDEIITTQIAQPAQRLASFDRLFCQHVRYAAGNLIRVVYYGVTGGLWVRVPKNRVLSSYYRQLTRMSTALAFTADIMLMVLGKQLKRKETASARLGDILSQLYLASAVIKYYQSQSCPSEDSAFVRWTLDRCLQQIQQAFDALLHNFAARGLGRILHWLIFPWGTAYRGPQDVDTQQIAAQMLKPSSQRDRLTAYCYVGKQPNDPTGRLELALDALEKMQLLLAQLTASNPDAKGGIAALIEQLQAAEGASIFSANELKSLQEFVNLRWEALRVDEFPVDYFKRSPPTL